ncbi:MAG: putative transposase, partial [Patescibacteria group bacterium]|nr:putative transposase [Patescibacteria group bacterium]
MEPESSAISEHGLLTLSSEAWEQLQQKSQVITPLAALPLISHHAADTAARQLGLSRRQIYVLIRRCRQGQGLLTDLIPRKSD